MFMRRRLALLAASSLAGLVLVSPGPSAAATPDCFATDFAGPCYSTFHDDFVDDVLCSFPVNVDVVGSVRYRPFFAKDGTLTRDETHTVFNATIVNPATGRSFSTAATSTKRRPTSRTAPSRSERPAYATTHAWTTGSDCSISPARTRR
jgi:hypothetical protein